MHCLMWLAIFSQWWVNSPTIFTNDTVMSKKGTPTMQHTPEGLQLRMLSATKEKYVDVMNNRWNTLKFVQIDFW